MINLAKKWIAGLLLLFLLSGPAWAQAQSHIGTVDLRKLFDGYWKKKQAEASLKERQADMDKEDKKMLEEYKKMKEEYATLQTSAAESAISNDERDKRKKAAEDKLKRMKEQEDLITQFERDARANLAQQSQRMRENILAEIRNVVNAKAKAAGFFMVIDTASESVNATPIVLYTNNENDLTEAVLLQLNLTAPTEPVKTDEKTLDSPREKKTEKK